MKNEFTFREGPLKKKRASRLFNKFTDDEL